VTIKKIKILGDSLAILAVIISAIILWDPVIPWLREGVIYVSNNGSNWHTGASPDRAVSTIQYAADLACPGDSIVILPGIYNERITIRKSGEPGKPIVIKAKVPGSVVITGRTSLKKDLAWKSAGDGIYSTNVPWLAYRIRAYNQELFKCHSIDNLKLLTSRQNAWGSFFQSNSRLFVRLKDKADPSRLKMEIHGPTPERLSNGVWRAANVWVEAVHVRLKGLRFAFGVGSGLHLWNASDITVEDCLFRGSSIGINASQGVMPSVNLRFDHCYYDNYPQGGWNRKWISWKEVYAFYSDSSLATVNSDGALILNNLILHGGDGMDVTTRDVTIDKGIDVSGNLIAWCTDDVIEFDGFAKQIRFFHNLVYDCHESLGTSPVLAGPVNIENNLFLHPSDGINGTQVKLMNPGTNKGPPWNGPIRNVTIQENTFVGNWLCWYGNPPALTEDIQINRNVFAVQRKLDPLWPPGITHSENIYIDLPESGYPNPGKDKQWLANLIAQKDDSAGPSANEIQIGATPTGKQWKMVRPGPRWLDWKSLPATAQLLDNLSPELFTSADSADYTN